MSRIGKAPVAIPAGVSVNVNGNVVTVKGPGQTQINQLKHLPHAAATV